MNNSLSYYKEKLSLLNKKIDREGATDKLLKERHRLGKVIAAEEAALEANEPVFKMTTSEVTNHPISTADLRQGHTTQEAVKAALELTNLKYTTTEGKLPHNIELETDKNKVEVDCDVIDGDFLRLKYFPEEGELQVTVSNRGKSIMVTDLESLKRAVMELEKIINSHDKED
jgi:hypothetical protein